MKVPAAPDFRLDITGGCPPPNDVILGKMDWKQKEAEDWMAAIVPEAGWESTGGKLPLVNNMA